MAAKRARSEDNQTDTFDDVMTCPVCTNDFTDPRLLSCGHHFCYGCLEKIAQAKGGGSIRCPTCRHITREKMQDLNKYKPDFAADVSESVDKKRTKIDKLCGLCDRSKDATFTCRECQVHLCDACRETHESLERISGHKATPLTEYLFCKEHPDNFVHCLCETCDQFLCLRCIALHDKAHSITDIKEAAAKAKERLKAKENSLQKDEELSKFVKDALKKIKDENDSINKYITFIENNMTRLQEKVRQFKERKEDAFKKELKELEILENDTANFIQTKIQQIQRINELIDSASDCETIRREKEFPKYTNDSVRSVFSKFTVNIPKVKEIQPIANQLLIMEKRFVFYAHPEPIITREEALQPMESFTAFKTCAGLVNGLAYDSNNDTYVVRSSDAEKLIQVFDTSGQIVQTIGSGREGIARPGRIAIDTRRGLYLLPTADGKIVTIDHEGHERNVINVARFRLIGISYCPVPKTGKDRYIVTSARFAGEKEETNHSIYILDSEKETVLKVIKEPNTTSPYSVTSFSSADKVRIAVGFNIGGVRLYDINGKITHVIKGPKEKELSKIQGLSCDVFPDVLACDISQDTVSSFVYNKYKNAFDDHRILYKLDDIKKLNPMINGFWLMAFDMKKRRILLTLRNANNSVLVLKEKR